MLAANTPAGKPGLKTCSLRPAAIYGERDNDVLPGILRVLDDGRSRFQVGPNTALFATTYAGNAADAHLLAAERLLAVGAGAAEEPGKEVAGEAFFVTNGADMPFFTFCRAAWREAGDKTRFPEDVTVVPLWIAVVMAWISETVAWLRGAKPRITVASLRFTTMQRYYNIDKARKRLGYEPAVEWDEGVRRGVRVRVPTYLTRWSALVCLVLACRVSGADLTGSLP